MEEVPTRTSELTDETLVSLAVLDFNRHRDKTDEDKAREYKARLPLEEALAKQRQGERTDIVDNFPQGGKARDLAAEPVGWSGKTAEKAAKVVDAIDKLEEDGKQEDADDVRGKLNGKSVNAADALLKKKQ